VYILQISFQKIQSNAQTIYLFLSSKKRRLQLNGPLK
jgi:hypothetical protein